MCSVGDDEVLTSGERDLEGLFEKRQRGRVTARTADDPAALEQHSGACDARFSHE